MTDKTTPVWRSTKTYTRSVGLSVCYRNWKAKDTHCSKLHGYALEVSFAFEATELDERNFVVDFGGLKNLKGWLENIFDHKCMVAEDDPERALFDAMHARGLIDMIEMPSVSTERFAELIYEYTEQWLIDAGFGPRCSLVSVEVRDHESNSAVFFKRDQNESVLRV